MGNAYDNASLILTPNGYRAGKMYSAIPTDGSGDFTFTRAGVAMRRNSVGLLEEAAANVPRLNYPVGGGCPSWLFEPQRTNICLRSIEFDDATWIKLNATIIANSTVAPDGTPTADSIVDNITDAAHRVSQAGISVTSGTTYTMSVYVKKGSVNYLNLAFGSSQFGANGAFFDLTNFTVFSVSAGHSATITSEGNGWYRFTFTANCTVTGSTSVFINPTTSNISVTYIGTGGTSVVMWGAQIEVASSASSPIITAGSALTRLADVSTLSGASELIGQTEGTIFIEAQLHGQSFNDNIFRFLGGISDGSANNRIELYRFNNQITYIAVRAGATFATGIIHTIIDFSPSNFKVAITYQTNQVKTFYNGLASISATPTSIMPACNRMTLGCRQSGDLQYSGLIISAILAPLLSDAECIALTT
jgi:hypothetical protein